MILGVCFIGFNKHWRTRKSCFKRAITYIANIFTDLRSSLCFLRSGFGWRPSDSCPKNKKKMSDQYYFLLRSGNFQRRRGNSKVLISSLRWPDHTSAQELCACAFSNIFMGHGCSKSESYLPSDPLIQSNDDFAPTDGWVCLVLQRCWGKDGGRLAFCL